MSHAFSGGFKGQPSREGVSDNFKGQQGRKVLPLAASSLVEHKAGVAPRWMEIMGHTTSHRRCSEQRRASLGRSFLNPKPQAPKP